MRLKHTAMMTMMAAALSAAPAWANENSGAAEHGTATPAASHNSHFEQIAGHAKKIQFEAREISGMLRSKQVDFAKVGEKMELLDKHVSEVSGLVHQVENSGVQLKPSQRAEFDRLKEVTEILDVFVENKKTMLARADAAKNRSLLRAKADGIATRAGMVEKSALRIHS